MEFITIPFGWLLNTLYQWTGNYGVSLILFAILVQIVLLPITAKSKKSMMKMTRIQPKLNAVREKYANDQQKQQEAIAQIQKEEGVGMGCGGCLWSFVPLLILIPLYTIIREPLSNMLGADEAVRAEIAKILNLDVNNGYWQITAAQAIFADPARFADIPGITAQTLAGINYNFLGIPMGNIPSELFGSWSWSWACIGTMLVPLISAGSQILQTQISRRVNDSLVTNDKGVQDKEAAEKSQSAQTSKVMMWMMPIMSLFIGFSVPAALSLYWFVGGVVRTVEDIVLTKKSARSMTPRMPKS